MSDNSKTFEKRKQDHIDLALMSSNQASESNSLDHFHLTHEALPDLDFTEIDITSQRFNQPVQTPFLVSSMTAGHEQAALINYNLLAACEQMGWAMGVGSQRRELFDEQARLVWQPLRKEFPHVQLFGNLGVAQLVTTSQRQIHLLIESLQADGLIIHCNPLQEAIQPEGTPHYRGCWHALDQLVSYSPVPIIVKETGCGFSTTTLERLNTIGVSAVDVSGLGGTHWGRIEGHRARGDKVRFHAAETFKHWGINTLQSIENARNIFPSFEIWGSGGVRHGLDAAKLLTVGASTIGFAKRLLEPALKSVDEVCHIMNTIHYELKIAMFCTGSRLIEELKEKACL